MKRSLALVFAFVLLASLLVSGAALAAPKMNVAILVQDDEMIHDWDPAISYSSDHHIFLQVYENLVRYDANSGEYINVLATDYAISEDGLDWTFHLRQDATFHCGAPFNAAAVKYSIERNKNMQKGASYLWNELKEVEVVDDYTVIFHLTDPIGLLEVLSCQYDAYIYCPTCAGEDLKASSEWFYRFNMCGTGPYMLQDYTKGSNLILTKYENYYGGWKDNQYDKVVFQKAIEASSRRQMIEGGEAQVAINIVPTDAESLANNPNLTVNVVDASKIVNCYFNTLKAPLDNVLVRKALMFAFPFNDVVDYVKLGKYGVFPSDAIAPHVVNGATKSQPYHYDLEQAKSLLAEAGYPDGGFEVNVTFNTDNGDTRKMAELWASELAKLGVTLKIEGGAWDAVYGTAKSEDPQARQNIFLVETSVDTMGVYSTYASGIMTDASWNFSGFGDPELDEAYKQAYYQCSTDPENGIAKMQEIAEKYAENCAVTNLCDMRLVIVTSKDLGGFVYNAAYDNTVFFYDCYKVAE